MSMDQQETFAWLVERSNRLEEVDKENAALKARLQAAEEKVRELEDIPVSELLAEQELAGYREKAHALDWLSENLQKIEIDPSCATYGLWLIQSRDHKMLVDGPTRLAAIQAAQRKQEGE